MCTLPNLGAGGVARFKANLLGSHDDSIASLSMIFLNGTPIKCREGSKTESRFEDGEVTLDCGFSTPAPLIGGHLKVKISLHHLQLNRTELALE